ncbi:MAG: hypothetical protein JWM90_345 [Thermoleophilia bacterium]|nr:hypothetical protein [Thermoleophilia bacterium]
MYLVPLLAAVAAMWAGTDSAMQIATTAVIFIAELGIIAVLVPRRALQFGAVAAIMFLLVLVALVGALESWMGTLVSLAAVVFAATPGLVWAGRSAPVALDQGVRMVGRRIFGIIGVLVAQGLLVLPVVVPISIMAGRSLGRGDVGFAAIQSVAALGAVVTSAMFAVIVREEIRMEAERVDAGARPATT